MGLKRHSASMQPTMKIGTSAKTFNIQMDFKAVKIQEIIWHYCHYSNKNWSTLPPFLFTKLGPDGLINANMFRTISIIHARGLMDTNIKYPLWVDVILIEISLLRKMKSLRFKWHLFHYLNDWMFLYLFNFRRNLMHFNYWWFEPWGIFCVHIFFLSDLFLRQIMKHFLDLHIKTLIFDETVS